MAKYIELKKLLKKNGFIFLKFSKGSHEVYIHKPTRIWTILPKHSNQEVSKGTEMSIKRAIKNTKNEQI